MDLTLHRPIATARDLSQACETDCDKAGWRNYSPGSAPQKMEPDNSNVLGSLLQGAGLWRTSKGVGVNHETGVIDHGAGDFLGVLNLGCDLNPADHS